MIAGAFNKSTALNVVSELGIADMNGKEKVPVSELAKMVDAMRVGYVSPRCLDPSRWGVWISIVVASRTSHADLAN